MYSGSFSQSKTPLDDALVEKIASAVLTFGKIDIQKFDITLYQYQREERRKAESLELAWWDPDDNSINVEVPTVERIKDDACLAFVFLHELAHADGADDHELASNLAMESLREANVLSPEWIESLRAVWQKASYDADAIGKESAEILRRKGINLEQASKDDWDNALDEARINLLCGNGC
ncbi:MAG: hypothetical protein HY247_05870 [archaeon]|nr:MAG: hypothetical protein HY247_05870 [archaeon]